MKTGLATALVVVLADCATTAAGEGADPGKR